jgi:hypothetical protein
MALACEPQAALVVTEPVTNVVHHAASPIQIHAEFDAPPCESRYATGRRSCLQCLISSTRSMGAVADREPGRRTTAVPETTRRRRMIRSG